MQLVVDLQATSVAQALYERARGQARRSALLAALRRRTNSLVTFEQVKAALNVTGQHQLGIRSVAVSAIVGTVGRYHDFDRDFNPITKHTRPRWERLSAALMLGVQLPPVELYKLGDAYFVKDGNHRVSVAKQLGISYLDAIVTEFTTASPTCPEELRALAAAA